MMLNVPRFLPDDFIDKLFEAHEAHVEETLNVPNFARAAWVKDYYKSIMSADLHCPD